MNVFYLLDYQNKTKMSKAGLAESVTNNFAPAKFSRPRLGCF